MEYSEYISTLRKNRQNRIFMNSDSEKRKIVYRELLQCANSNLRFFAGNLCDEITDSEEFVEGISDFVEKRGNLEIILNQYDEDLIKSSNLYKRLAYYSAKHNAISVMRTSMTVTISIQGHETPAHFAVADQLAYRLEVDIEKRNAVCNMNDGALAQSLIDIFKQISSDSQTQTVDLVKLFSLKTKE